MKYLYFFLIFGDLHKMSQEVSPEAIAAFLNDSYFSPMGREIAYKHNGTVDKHIGDSIMVVLGSPVTHSVDAVRAVRSAIAIQQKAKEIDSSLNKQDGLRLKIGIGISTGKVFSGILGSLRKKEFTSIGMAVNVAARLESMAGEGEILINESTVKKIEGQMDVEPLPPAIFKGVSEPVKVYRIKTW